MWRSLRGLTGQKVISTIVEAEPFGPQKLFHCMIIAPCTGNTMAKLANAITDTAPLMAAKRSSETGRPLVLAISTNDALGLNAKNLGILLQHTEFVFCAFWPGQSEREKPRSLVADMTVNCPSY